jgi:hypothetical protein
VLKKRKGKNKRKLLRNYGEMDNLLILNAYRKHKKSWKGIYEKLS